LCQCFKINFRSGKTKKWFSFSSLAIVSPRGFLGVFPLPKKNVKKLDTELFFYRIAPLSLKERTVSAIRWFFSSFVLKQSVRDFSKKKFKNFVVYFFVLDRAIESA